MLQVNNSEYKCMVLMFPCSGTVQGSLPLSSSLPFLQPAPCSEEWLLLPALSRLPCLLISGCVCPMGSTNRGSENWRWERSGCYFSWLPPEGLQLWWHILTLLATASFTGDPLLQIWLFPGSANCPLPSLSGLRKLNGSLYFCSCWLSQTLPTHL